MISEPVDLWNIGPDTLFKCGRCGEVTIGPENADSHALTCPKHPMRAVEAGRDEAVAMLRRIEWWGMIHTIENGMAIPYRACPFCDGIRFVHAPDCGLAAILAKHSEPPAPATEPTL